MVKHQAAEIVTVPCLADNYAFLIHDGATGATALVDAPEAGPIQSELTARGWRLTDILITHHHHDHIDGVEALRAAHGATVWGAAADAHRLPALDHALAEGDSVQVGDLEGVVLDVSGHTVGHIAFHFPGAGAVFTGDSLMALGCGRLFEGTAPMMWKSLQKLRALPGQTLVCSGHEYTMANGRFAQSIEPENSDLISRLERIAAARRDDTPTVPSVLSEEIATNPFLRADHPDLLAAIGHGGDGGAAVFADIRRRKDQF